MRNRAGKIDRLPIVKGEPHFKKRVGTDVSFYPVLIEVEDKNRIGPNNLIEMCMDRFSLPPPDPLIIVRSGLAPPVILKNRDYLPTLVFDLKRGHLHLVESTEQHIPRRRHFLNECNTAADSYFHVEHLSIIFFLKNSTGSFWYLHLDTSLVSVLQCADTW